VTALAVDPHDDNTVYLGASSGGLWKTTDGGQTWTPLTDFFPSLAVSALAISPANNSVIYAGTGEACFSPVNYYGAGLIVSTDKGATWTHRPGPFAGIRGPLSPCNGGSFISELAAHPTNSGTVLAAVRFGNCPYIGQVGSVPTLDGIYRSTDSGATWTLVLPGAPGTSVLFDPTNGNIAYAALSNPSNTYNLAPATIWKSSDGGATWTKQNSGLPTGSQFGRTKMAIAPSNPSLLYASVTNTGGGGLLGLYRTTNGGATWSSVPNPPDYCVSACTDHLALTIHPTNPNIIYIGGTATYRSNDGGNTWTPVWIWYVNGTDYATHPDLHAFAFTPSGSRLYMGNDGGAWSTNDYTSANAVWTSLNSGLSIAQFYSVAVHPTDATTAYAGSQDNAVQQYKSSIWSGNVCGDGGPVALDTLGNVYAECLVSDTQLYKSTDSGVTYQPAMNGLPTDYFQILRSALQTIFPMVMDPTNTGRLYFGTYQVFQSKDGAGSWNAISSDLTSGGMNWLNAIAVAPNTPGIIYAGTSDGLVQITSGALGSGTPTWSQRNQGLPSRPVTAIAIDPSNAANAWVAYSGFSGFNGDTAGHIFHTANSGQTWSDVSGNLPNVPVNTVVLDPDRSGAIYIGTDEGVFWSTSGGTNWAQLGTALPRVPVRALTLHKPSRTLWAATYGRGMWQLNLPTSLAFGAAFTGDAVVNGASYQAAAVAPDEWIAIFGNLMASTTAVASNLGTSLAGTSVSITDSTGKSQAALMYVVAPGQVNCLLPSNLAPGPAVLTLTKPDGTQASVTVRVEPTLPGIFSANANGKGVAAAYYSLLTASTDTVATQVIFNCGTSGCTAAPLSLGGASDQGVLQLYGTGLRHYSGSVAATIGGVAAQVQYAGAGGGYAGLDQINILVPHQLAGKGEVPIVILVDGKPTNTVTASFQ
jgi:uncharacterized protein (TIGR03437 family)